MGLNTLWKFGYKINNIFYYILVIIDFSCLPYY